MSDLNPFDGSIPSRRRLLRASGGAIGLAGLGSARIAAADAGGDGSDSDDDSNADTACPDATVEPSTIPYDDSLHEVCADDHPETEAIQDDVKSSLEEAFPTVGALLDAGFFPYLDFFTEGTWSHWINPEFIGDGSVVDPDRPESILVDHTWWRPIGVMFVATDEDDPVDPPPTIYETDDDACTPWHAHVGLPGRYAWWKYQVVYGEDAPEEFPCRTPWMLHVWNYTHPESVYAHGPPDERGGPPAEDPGFETDADPSEEELSPEHLPDALLDRVEKLWRTSA